MVNKFNIKIFNTKFNVKPKHIEICLIVITLLMGICVVYLYKNKMESHIKENYTNHTKKILLFYAPWCGASKSFLPIWDKLENNENIKTEKYDVDRDDNKDITKKFNIEYLPTLFIVNGDKKLKYDGERKYENIITFFNNNL